MYGKIAPLYMICQIHETVIGFSLSPFRDLHEWGMGKKAYLCIIKRFNNLIKI